MSQEAAPTDGAVHLQAGGRRLFGASPPRICTVAGSDSGGGAGIQADLKTIIALGGYGLSAITALTAQSTVGVSAIHHVPGEFVTKQLEALRDDIRRIDSFKIGMLANADVVRAVIKHLSSLEPGTAVVLDPVMVSTSGSMLLEEAAVTEVVKGLLPLCDLVTPNVPETVAILRHLPRGDAASSSAVGQTEITNVGDMIEAARVLCQSGAKAALVKGGHLHLEQESIDEFLGGLSLSPVPDTTRSRYHADLADLHGQLLRRKDGRIRALRSDLRPWSEVLRLRERGSAQQLRTKHLAVDVLYERELDRHTLFIKPFLRATTTHGTGCTLSSAIATFSAERGTPLARSVALGIDFVQVAIARGISDLGSGPGPLNHGCLLHPRAVPLSAKDHISETAPFTSALLGACYGEWQGFVRHPFLQKVGDGSLSEDSFRHFLGQDYLFLRQYANVWAMAASKAVEFGQIRHFARLATAMADEATMHIALCRRWGLTEEFLEREQAESAATLSYTRFVLDAGRRGGIIDILVATLPCMLGYAEAGLLLRQTRIEDDNPFLSWIDAYASPDFRATALSAVDLLEELLVHEAISESRLETLRELFVAAVRLERAMWDEALSPENSTVILRKR